MLLVDGYFTPRQMQSPAVDPDEAPGTVLTSFYVTHPKIAIMTVGIIVPQASGGVTTPYVLRFTLTKLNGTTESLHPYAVMAVGANMPALSHIKLDLDRGLNENIPIRGPQDFPDAVLGERIDVEVVTTGVGGTVPGLIPFLVYHEKEYDTR